MKAVIVSPEAYWPQHLRAGEVLEVVRLLGQSVVVKTRDGRNAVLRQSSVVLHKEDHEQPKQGGMGI